MFFPGIGCIHSFIVGIFNRLYGYLEITTQPVIGCLFIGNGDCLRNDFYYSNRFDSSGSLVIPPSQPTLLYHVPGRIFICENTIKGQEQIDEI